MFVLVRLLACVALIGASFVLQIRSRSSFDAAANILQDMFPPSRDHHDRQLLLYGLLLFDILCLLWAHNPTAIQELTLNVSCRHEAQSSREDFAGLERPLVDTLADLHIKNHSCELLCAIPSGTDANALPLLKAIVAGVALSILTGSMGLLAR
jgi:hypothetical protein